MWAKGQNPQGWGVGWGLGEEREIESLRLTFCRPKKNFSLLSSPKSQNSLKGPLSSSLLWRCSLGWRNNVSNKQRWTAGLSLSFFGESYRLSLWPWSPSPPWITLLIVTKLCGVYCCFEGPAPIWSLKDDFSQGFTTFPLSWNRRGLWMRGPQPPSSKGRRCACRLKKYMQSKNWGLLFIRKEVSGLQARETASQVALRELFQGGKGRSQVIQKYMGRCKSLGSVKSFLWYAPQLSGASTLCFHSLSFLRAHQLTICGGCDILCLLIWQEMFHFSGTCVLHLSLYCQHCCSCGHSDSFFLRLLWSLIICPVKMLLTSREAGW